jgi:hypothetical protein
MASIGVRGCHRPAYHQPGSELTVANMAERVSSSPTLQVGPPGPTAPNDEGQTVEQEN